MITWRRAEPSSQAPKIQTMTHENAILRIGAPRCRKIGEKRQPRWRSIRVPIMAAMITAVGAIVAAVVAGAFNLFG